MILPDSTIEAAARAAWAESQKIERDPNLPPTWDDDISDHMRDGCRQLIRAALTAALPDLIEICAKVCDRMAEDEDKHEDDVAPALRKAAANIRSLFTSPDAK